MTPQAHARPELLIVDDTPENLQLLIGMLDERKYKVRPVPGGRLALKAAHAHVPDLILLDIMMPEMNGYEVCAQLKADPRTREVPVIFVTALSEAVDKVKAFAVGGVDFISKPFNFAEVEARIRIHLELQRQKRELQEGNVRLQELESLRDALVHMVVHDMKSPLAALRMSVDLLAKEPLAADAYLREVLRNARTSLHRLDDMTNQMLDLSRLEAGRMELVREPGDLVALIRQVCERPGIKEARRDLDLQLPAALPAVYDAAVVFRVLDNLLGNALKYTPEGGWVRVEAERAGSDCLVRVRDNGPGLPGTLLDRVFDKYVRGPQARKIQGTGLGLAFCRLAVEAHGGKVGVESREGAGSCFWFTLPAG